MNRALPMMPPVSAHDSVVRVRAAESERLADRAQRAWAVMPLEERLTRVARWQRRLLERADEITSEIAQASGVSEHDARSLELNPLFRALDALVTQKSFASLRRQHDARTLLHPVGVIEIASNGMFARPLFELASAIAAGNAVLSDHGEPMTRAWEIARQTFLQSGLPEDLWTQASDAVRWLEGPSTTLASQGGPALLVALSRQGVASCRSLLSALRPSRALRHRSAVAHICTTPDQVDELASSAPEVQVHAARHQHDVGEILLTLPRPPIVYVLDQYADRAVADLWRAQLIKFDATPMSDVEVLLATEGIGSRFLRPTVVIDSPLPPLSRAWNQLAKRWLKRS